MHPLFAAALQLFVLYLTSSTPPKKPKPKPPPP